MLLFISFRFFPFVPFCYFYFITLNNYIMAHESITAQDLREQLNRGVVQFFFVKKDGTLREVTGTTNLANIPTSGHPTGERRSSHKVVPFWDLIAQGWRCMQVTTQAFLRE